MLTVCSLAYNSSLHTRSKGVKEAADTLLAKISLREPAVQPDFSLKGAGHYLSKTLDTYRRNTTNFLHTRRKFACSLLSFAPLLDNVNSPSSFIQKPLLLSYKSQNMQPPKA